MPTSVHDAKLITCILPKGKAHALQEMIINEKGIQNVTYHGARGVGRFSPLTSRGIGEQQEKEILEVTVPQEDAEALFEFMFFEGEMNQAHGGIIYMTAIPRTTIMSMPELSGS